MAEAVLTFIEIHGCVRQAVQNRFGKLALMFLCSAERGRFFIPA